MKAKLLSIALTAMISAFAVNLVTSQAWAQAPTAIDLWSVYYNNGTNNINSPAGPILSQGALSVIPTTPLYGFETQTGGFPGGSLFTRPFDAFPHQVVANATAYDSAFTGAFTFHLSSTPTFDPGTVTTINTPAVGSAGLMPFATNVTISGSGLTPTINWDLPSIGGAGQATSIDLMQIFVFDITNQTVVTRINPFIAPFSLLQGNNVYSSLVTLTPSLTIPANNNNPSNATFGSPVLQYGDSYVIGVTFVRASPRRKR